MNDQWPTPGLDDALLHLLSCGEIKDAIIVMLSCG